MIEHILSIPQPQTRTVQVELRAPMDAPRASVDVAFPVWTPGSYLVREHQRHVHDFRAYAEDGRPLAVRKLDKHVYRLETAGVLHLRLTWEVYAHELTVRTCHVDGSHAFVNPVACCAWLPGREGERQRLVVRGLPEGWGVACALPGDTRPPDAPVPAPHGEAGPAAGGPGTRPPGAPPPLDDAPGRPASRVAGVFVAKDFDELVDSPLECGPHAAPGARQIFTVRGVPHELIVWGRTAFDLGRLPGDLARIAEAQAALFGGLPYPRYLFLLALADQGRGGLEHRGSCALVVPRSFHEKPRGYEDVLALCSHELFHAWNVKRIRPAAFTPYDLSRENYTRLLWAFEGLTSYYGDLLLRRAGLLTRARWLERLGEKLTALERVGGRRRLPLADASFDAWIRHYRQDENTENSAVSYYLKGELVGVLLDLEIRRRTGGRKSLDDAMRLLWERYGRTGAGVPEEAVEEICSEVAGEPLGAFFDLALRSTDELPLEPALASHGLRAQRRVSAGPDDKGGVAPSGPVLRCFLGASLRAEGEHVRVASVVRGSPAEQAGLAPGDELVAVDGLRAEVATAFARLHDRAPGDFAELVVFRRDELLDVSIEAAPPREDAFQVAVDPEAPADALARLESWLGADEA